MIEFLTPTQQRMFELLGDYRSHERKELHALLSDEMGALSNIQPHISTLRKRIKPLGYRVICEIENGRICYRLLNGQPT